MFQWNIRYESRTEIHILTFFLENISLFEHETDFSKIFETTLKTLGSKSNLAKIQSFNISISNSVISPSSQCRNLGVMLNSSMSLSTHVSSICKSVRYQLRNLGFIRKYLSRSTTEKLVHALISSRLDFCNSILYLLPNTQLSRLQKLQNTVARIVTLSSRRTHITPILKTLHWLPVCDRIIFKLLLLSSPFVV